MNLNFGFATFGSGVGPQIKLLRHQEKGMWSELFNTRPTRSRQPGEGILNPPQIKLWRSRHKELIGGHVTGYQRVQHQEPPPNLPFMSVRNHAVLLSSFAVANQTLALLPRPPIMDETL